MIDTFISEEHISAGQKLRKIRMDRGLTLNEVARVTRITKAYLLALEEDSYEKLPSEAYARGFLRIYSNFLGLPADEVLCLYQPGVSGELLETSVSATPGVKPECVNKSFSKRSLWLITGACLAALSVFFLFGVKEHGLSTDKKSLQVSSPTENPVAFPLHVPLSSARRTGNMSQNLPAETDIPANDSLVKVPGIILKMRALEDGYLNLTIDDAITQHYDLKSGDLIEWKADKVFSLDMENAGGVEAELNGKLLKPFGEKGAPAHIVLSAGYNGEKTER